MCEMCVLCGTMVYLTYLVFGSGCHLRLLAWSHIHINTTHRCVLPMCHPSQLTLSTTAHEGGVARDLVERRRVSCTR